jgi:hypothetical protein
MVNEKGQSQSAAAAAKHGGPAKATPLIAKALLTTLLITGLVAAGSHVLSGGLGAHGDDVSPSDAQVRLEAFSALDAIVASKVSTKDVDSALQGMNLGASAQKSLRADLGLPASSTTNASGMTPVIQPQAQAAAPRMQLVWIRLWDTDVEDGDVVRIESGGYARTVRLTKRGEIFAVPVPPDGLIHVTGVKDGDGGGITVGLASGPSQAIFPIMSEGQVLGLKVKVD